MPSTYVHDKFEVLTDDGNADGIATIGSTSGWLPGCVVWLNADGEDSLECTVVEQVSATELLLRRKDSPAARGFSDLSAYTVAKNATLSMEGQVVPVRDVFEPRERA